MIITLKKDAPQAEIDKLVKRFENMDLQVTMIQGANYNVFGLVGDTSKVDEKRTGQPDRNQRAACRAALQARQPHVPSGRYHRQCGRNPDRRQKDRAHCRSMFCRKRRADHPHCRRSQGMRRRHAARRRL